jgi:hypothetical protein
MRCGPWKGALQVVARELAGWSATSRHLRDTQAGTPTQPNHAPYYALHATHKMHCLLEKYILTDHGLIRAKQRAVAFYLLHQLLLTNKDSTTLSKRPGNSSSKVSELCR